MKNKGNKRNINKRLVILIALVIVVILVLIFTTVKLTRKDKKEVNIATTEKPYNPTENSGDYSKALYDYFKDREFQQVQGTNTIDNTNSIWLFTSNKNNVYSDYIEYKGGIYKAIYTDLNMYTVKEVIKVNAKVDFNKAGVYDIDGIQVLVTPDSKNEIVHIPIDLSQYIGTVYYLKENGKDIDLNRKVTENIYSVDESVRNSSNEVINIINAEGPLEFLDVYYLNNKGELDFDKPLEKGYYSNLTDSYYDESGNLVDVIISDGME